MPIRSPRRLYEITEMQVNLDDDPDNVDIAPLETVGGLQRNVFVKMKEGIGDYLGMIPVPYNDPRLTGVFAGNGLNLGATYRRRLGGFRVASYTLIAKTTFVISERYFDSVQNTVVIANKEFKTMSIGFPKGHSVSEFIDFIVNRDNVDKIQAIRSPNGALTDLYISP